MILAEILSLERFLFRQRALETDCPMVDRITPHRSPLYWHPELNKQVQRFPYSWHRAHLPPSAPWSSRLFNCQTTTQIYQRIEECLRNFRCAIEILLASMI